MRAAWLGHVVAPGFFETKMTRGLLSKKGDALTARKHAALNPLAIYTDPLLGWTTVDGVGYVVAEVSPYEVDRDWGGLTEPDDIHTARLDPATERALPAA